MKPWRATTLAVMLPALALAQPDAQPAERLPAPRPTELAAIFLQGCVPFAGAPAALRAWATQRRLPILPEPARSAFLNGAQGVVFDASSGAGKFVLASADDGLCACVTDSVSGQAVAQALETELTRAGATYRLAIERDDPRAPNLHYREYLVRKDRRTWRILVATVNHPQGGQAMLTAGPHR